MSKKEMNLAEGPILSRMIFYTLPLLFSGTLQLLYNAADLVVVGNKGEAGEIYIAAIGATGALTNLIIGLFLGLSVGSCVVLSQYLGARDDKNASEVVHTSMLASAIIGVVLAGIGVAFADDFLLLMQTDPEVIDLSTLYMRIYFAGLPASMIYNFGAAILRAKGDTKYPLLVLVISGAANVLLNLLMVFVFDRTVDGVAIATVASQVISAVMVVIYLCRLKDSCKLILKKLSIKKDKLLRIIRVGLPAGFQSVVFSISNVMLQSSVNVLGKAAMAGNASASSIDSFINIAQNSVYHAAIAFVGQSYGAGNMKRVKKVAFTSIVLVTVIGLVFGGVVFAFGKPLLGIYGLDDSPAKAEALQNGIMRFNITALTYFICGIMDVMTGLLRGVGCSLVPMIITATGVCGTRILWIKLLFERVDFFHNIFWLYMSYPISWMISVIAQTITLIIVYRRIEKRMNSSPPASPDIKEEEQASV